MASRPANLRVHRGSPVRASPRCLTAAFAQMGKAGGYVLVKAPLQTHPPRPSSSIKGCLGNPPRSQAQAAVNESCPNGSSQRRVKNAIAL